MDGRTDGLTDGRTDGRTYRQTDRRTDGHTDGRTNERTLAKTQGRVSRFYHSLLGDNVYSVLKFTFPVTRMSASESEALIPHRNTTKF